MYLNLRGNLKIFFLGGPEFKGDLEFKGTAGTSTATMFRLVILNIIEVNLLENDLFDFFNGLLSKFNAYQSLTHRLSQNV